MHKKLIYKDYSSIMAKQRPMKLGHVVVRG